MKHYYNRLFWAIVIIYTAYLLSGCQKEMCNQPSFQMDGRIIGHTHNGKDDGILMFINVTGNSPFEYSIDNGKTWSKSNIASYTNDFTVSGLKTGNYFMIVRGSDGCISNTFPATIEPR